MNGLITNAEVREFVKDKYKPSRLDGRNAATGWDDDYADNIIAGYTKELNQPGKAQSLISKHESVTNEAISFNRLNVLSHWYRNHNKSALQEEKKTVMQSLSKIDKEQDWQSYAILTSRCNVINIKLRELAIGD